MVSLELEFKASDADGKQFNFKLNDSLIDYKKMREHVPESICIGAIEKIKKASGKKCALLFGNCQMGALLDILSRHVQFRKECLFLVVPSVFMYDKRLLDLIYGGKCQFLQLVDIFISQHVKDTNRFGSELATQNISGKLSGDCRIIWIPDTYFMGTCPQRISQTHRVGSVAMYPQGRFPHGDKYIDRIMEDSKMNPDIETILDKIIDPRFIPSQTIQEEIDKSLAELKRREWFCEVKISDYIETNMSGKRLFYSMNHPIPQVLMEVARRILRAIDIRSDNFLELHNLLDDSNMQFSLIGQDVPIYPSVLKFFEIEETPKIYWANRYIWNFCADFRDFMREYIKQCWAEKFTNQS